MEVLGHVVQAQVQAGLHAGPAGATEAGEDGDLGDVQRLHHAAVLFGQGELALLHVGVADGFEQVGLELQVAAQFEVQAGDALAHGPVGKQGGPQDREQAVPERAGEQVADRADGLGAVAGAVLFQADHGVDGQGDGGLGDGRIAFAERAEQGEAEGGHGQCGDEQPGPGEQFDHRGGGDDEAEQGEGDRFGPAPPVVVGFGDGAGDDAEEHAGQRGQLVQVPAQAHGHRQRDEYPQAVAGLFMRPQAAQAGFSGGHAGSGCGAAHYCGCGVKGTA